jgi:hypothetical protein
MGAGQLGDEDCAPLFGGFGGGQAEHVGNASPGPPLSAAWSMNAGSDWSATRR